MYSKHLNGIVCATAAVAAAYVDFASDLRFVDPLTQVSCIVHASIHSMSVQPLCCHDSCWVQ